ncbi:MAG: hypothetical protein HYY14_03065 [Candidatus Omnitrophica bacterium]|nr:hypothetical protein [Candidatus Omnitrophota bacterium]
MMRQLHQWFVWGFAAICFVPQPSWAQGATATSAYNEGAVTQVHAPSENEWSFGFGPGFLASTPDDTAFTLNASLDRFVSDRVSFGPMAQLGFSDDMALFGLSGQGKYWMDLPETEGVGRVYLHAGAGFVHSDFRDSDTSWLIPVGFGYDHAISPNTSLDTRLTVNFTDLKNGRGADADVMPGVSVGLRF